MAQPLIVPLPPGLVLSDGDKIFVSAVRADNGADVGGVKVQAISFWGTSDTIDALAGSGFVPLLRTT